MSAIKGDMFGVQSPPKLLFSTFTSSSLEVLQKDSSIQTQPLSRSDSVSNTILVGPECFTLFHHSGYSAKFQVRPGEGSWCGIGLQHSKDQYRPGRLSLIKLVVIIPVVCGYHLTWAHDVCVRFVVLT